MGKTSLFDLGPDGLNRLFALGQEEAEAGETPKAKEIDLSSSAGASTESIGSWVDRYKLVRVLGEGGMGIVYLAEQEHPINRQVALKVIKPGMDSRRVIARFEAERKTLARLDHPNIAHIFDAGTTTSGRPYFVMEYVEGPPVTEYCDRNKLSVNERLGLFVQVCQAVHHAHQKGFIHRDIKPSNILVTLQDGRPIPKVIDFGVARALSQPLTKETLFTQQGQLVGTPEYMSPEQIDLADEGADTRSDVYSLGVLLYVLLTGVLPFESDTLRGGGIEHLRKVIREQDPKTPSTRLTGLGDKAIEIAGNRRTEVGALTHSLHKELEWIPLKAMRKEREQRYQSVGELTQDIRNYLAGTPLIAGPPSVSYRLKKLVARNKPLVVATVFMALTISVGLIVSLTMYIRAQVQSERTKAVSSFLSASVLGALNAYRPQGGEVTPVSILDAVSAAIESRFDDAPLVEAKVRYGLGRAYWSHGQYDASVEHLKRALSLQRQELGTGDLSTVATMVQLGVALSEAGRRREAEPHLLEVVAQRTRQLGEADSRTLWAMNILARNCMGLGKYDQAMRLSEDTLSAAQRAGDDKNAEMAAYTISIIHAEQGRYDDAERWSSKALQMAERVRTEDHPVLGDIFCHLGSVYRAQGRYGEAESLLNESLARANQIFGEDHWQTSMPLRQLARLYVAWDKPEEAARWRARLKASSTAEVGSSSGSIRYDPSNKAYVIHGSGMAIWDNFDEFCFAYKELSGDGSITARIDSIEHVKGWTEAGIMIRNALDPTSEHASVLITVNGAIGFLHRGAARGPTRGVSIYPKDFVFPHWIRLTRKGNTFTAEHANDGISWEPVVPRDPNLPRSLEVQMSETVYVGLAASSHDTRRTAEVRISNVSLTGDVSPGGSFTVSQDISLLATSSEADETSQKTEDIEEPRNRLLEDDLTLGEVRTLSLRHGVSAGRMSYDDANDTYTIQGAGTDIWYGADQFHYAHNQLNGDGSIAARIDSIEYRHDWTKAGVMIRNTTASDSAFATVFITPERRVCLQYRLAAGENARTIHTNRSAVALPHWVRLVRAGNTFQAQHSEDGVTWKNLEGSNVLADTTDTEPAIAEIEMSDPVRIGLAVCSLDGPTVPAEAKISHVTVTGDVEPKGAFLWSEDIGFQMIALPKE